MYLRLWSAWLFDLREGGGSNESDLLQKETIVFEGKEYPGISVLTAAYGKNPGLVFDRLAYGNTLDWILKQDVRKINRPEYAVEYHGKIYESKRQLGKELGISIVCLRTASCP